MPSVYPSMENSDLVIQEVYNSEDPTHSTLDECDRQPVQARPDHPNIVVSLPEVFQLIYTRWHHCSKTGI